MAALPVITNDFRQSVMELQADMLVLPQVECPLVHRFANGVYAREVTIPSDTIVVGKIHRHEHLNFLMKGEITVVTETGTMRLVAPCTFISPPGTKRAAYAHTEVVWTNVIATQSTDPEEIEREMICDDYNDPAFLDHAIREIGGNPCHS
jgi:hypothetical protein